MVKRQKVQFEISPKTHGQNTLWFRYKRSLSYALNCVLILKGLFHKVYAFRSHSEEAHVERWEKYMAEEWLNLKEKEVKEQIGYKLDQNAEK